MVVRRGSQLAVLLALVALLASCVTASLGARADEARAVVSDLARTIGVERHDDIDGFARSSVDFIDSLEGDSVALVGIFAMEQENPDDPFGVLVFHVRYEAAQVGKHYVDAFDECYEAEFGAFGATDYWVFHSDVDPGEVPCPDNPIPVTPLVDDSTVFIVAPNAEAMAIQILSELTDESRANADELAHHIEGLLEQPSGPFQQLALPAVVVEDRGIGVAMGSTPQDCVLVARIDGEVFRVRPAPIQLEQGELGCRPETAITDPDQLRSPH